MSDSAEIVADVRKRDEEKHLVYCVALEPETFDLQKDILSFDTIEKAAHHYMSESRVVGDLHLTEADAEVVESYLAPVDFEMEGQRVLKGSWVMVIKVHDEVLWSAIKSGEYTGLSVGGVGVRVPYEE